MNDPWRINDSSLIGRATKALNLGQLTGMPFEDLFDFGEEVHKEVQGRVTTPGSPKALSDFNVDAPPGVDPITGATIEDYSHLLRNVVQTARQAGYNTRAAAEMGISGLMHNLDLTADYISRKTGMEKGGLFKTLHEHAVTRGKYFKTRAKEEGIGPIAEFFTDALGGAVPGIADFILDLPGLFPLHATRAAEKAAVKGDSEFVGLLKGAMERGLMGNLFHAASFLPRSARIPLTGAMFEEQARAEGETDPATLAKTFLTGGLFGSMGGPGKFGMRDLVNNLRELEKEFPITFPPSGGGTDIDYLKPLRNQRGSLGDENPTLTEESGLVRKESGGGTGEESHRGFVSNTGRMVESMGDKQMPANEWEKRIVAWEGKYAGLKDENAWNGLHEWLKEQGKETVTKEDLLGFLEESKQGWLVKEQYTRGGEPDPWASHNIPGGIRGTEQVWAFRMPNRMEPDAEELKYLQEEWDKVHRERLRLEKVRDFANSNDLSTQEAILYDRILREVNPARFESAHFPDIPDVVFHIRTHKMKDKDGKIGLVAETIQSDWHQQRGEGSDIPPAPFEKTWHEAGLKQVLDMAAADPEVEWVGWPSGKVQMERWGKGGQENVFTDPRFDAIYDREHKKFERETGRKPTEREEDRISDLAVDMFLEEFGEGGKPPGTDFLEVLYDSKLPKFAKKYAPKIGGEYKRETIYPEKDREITGPRRGLEDRLTREEISVEDYDREVAELTGTPYDIHRIDLPPQAKEKINREGQVFYSGIDITQLPRILKELGEDVKKAAPYIRQAGEAIWESGKKAHEDFMRAMETGLGEHWVKFRESAEKVYESLQAAQLALSKEETDKLLEQTRKVLSDHRIASIKKVIREQTGQTKVSDIIEVREDKALESQIRFAARQAKVAFSEGKDEGWWEGELKGVVTGLKRGFQGGIQEGKEIAAENFHARMELKKAKDKQRVEVKKMIGELKTLDTSKMTDYAREEIDSLLEGLDPVKISDKKWIKTWKTAEWLERNPDAELPDHVIDEIARLDKTPMRDLTYDQLKAIHTAVMHLAEMSDKAQHLWDGIQKRRFGQALKDSVDEMRGPDQIIKDVVSTKPSLWDKVLSVGDWVRQTLGIRQDSYDLICETLSGINSTMYNVFYRMIKEGDRTGTIYGKGIVGQKRMIQEQQAQFRKDLEDLGFEEETEFRYGPLKSRNVDRWLNDRITVEGDKTWILSRGERMALYLHSLNDDNRTAILESGIGFKKAPPSSGIRPNEVIQISEGDLIAIVNSLSTAEKKFSEAARLMFERQGAALDEAFYALNKYRMELVDNYYPKEVMPLSRGGMDLETEEGMEAFRQFTARVGIEKGMLIARVGSTKPIYLNDLIFDVTRSSTRAATYVNLEGPLRNASHLLYDNEFKRNLIDRYGREVWVELEKGLKDISNQYRSWTETEKGIMRVKTNAVSSILSLNPFIWVNQPASLSLYSTYIDAKYLIRGTFETSSPSSFVDTLNTIRAYSPEIVDRMAGGYDRDIAAAFQGERAKDFYGGRMSIKELGISPTRYADLTAVVPGMKAAYLKAMDEFQTGKLSGVVQKALNASPSQVVKWDQPMMEEMAWKFADWCTERTQAQSTPEHRPPLSRSSSTLEQVFTSLSSQQNAMLNLVRRTTREWQRTGDPEDRNAMIKAWVNVFVINAAFMIGIDRVRDLFYGRESKPLSQAFADNAASIVMFLREFEAALSSHIYEGERGFDVKYPVNRFGEVLTKMGVDVNKMVTSENELSKEKAINDFADQILGMMALLSGYPYQTPKRIYDAAAGNNPPPPKYHDQPDFIDELID